MTMIWFDSKFQVIPNAECFIWDFIKKPLVLQRGNKGKELSEFIIDKVISDVIWNWFVEFIKS